jgi:molecular chaperone DnaJ
VKVPPGIEEGMALRVAGHGQPSPQKGVGAGDLLVVIRSLPDEHFARSGADLWRDETIDVTDAVLGTKLKVPALDGEAKVSVPSGTQPDTVLGLAGKGLPSFKARGHGSLFVRVNVRVPEAVSEEERKLWERLRHCAARPNRRPWRGLPSDARQEAGTLRQFPDGRLSSGCRLFLIWNYQCKSPIGTWNLRTP